MAQKGITYLNDSGCEIDGVKFWGSPITPWFHNWAFNRMRGAEIKEHWNLIPDNTNVLITHGPPYGFGDRPFGKHDRVGCEDLMSVVNRVKPKLHVFGHIHGSAGEQFFNGTHFVNASVVNEIYSVVNSPVVVDLT
jgi:Icc-related predicted phosphoesterase